MAQEAVKTGTLRDCPFGGKFMNRDAAELFVDPEARSKIREALVHGPDPYRGLEYMKECPELKRLHLRVLDAAALFALQGFGATELMISNTKEISLPDLKHLAYLTQLKSLVLDGIDMTDEALLLVAACPTLTSVSMRGCSGVTSKGAAALDALKPGIRVVM